MRIWGCGGRGVEMGKRAALSPAKVGTSLAPSPPASLSQSVATRFSTRASRSFDLLLLSAIYFYSVSS
jgi:hypothetical protein